MKASLLKITFFTALLSLSACVETTSPLCNNTNRTDVPGLDRNYVLSMLVDPSQSMEERPVKITHVGPGVYRFEGSSTDHPTQNLQTCKVGRWTVAEAQTDYGTYQQTLLSQQSGGVLTLNQLIVDVNTLIAGNVQYRIVDRPTSALQSLLPGKSGPNDSNSKVLVIATEAAHAQKVVSDAAKPMALGVSFY